MPHSTNVCYQFGPYRLNVAQRVLTRDGEAVSLTPKATEILMRLVMNAGQLLEKDDLLKEVWPDTFVEEANLTQNIFTLRRALGDERAVPKYIETVARRGYRFVASVRVDDLDEDTTAESDEEDSSCSNYVAPRVVVAVMPFINASGDEGLEYLAEGVTDNIINSLSRLSRLRVMSRSAVFRHRKTEIDPLQTGKALGAHAVLVGTVNAPPARVGAIHRRPAAITIAVELVDVATGWQLWGEIFDSKNKDLLQIQEAITRQLVANLKLKLTGEEEKRITARYTENADAYQAYLEGRYHWSRYTRTGIEKAIGHFRQAIELDPNYALAYAAIVDCYLRLATNYLPPEEYAPALPNEESDDPKMDALNAAEERIKLRFKWDWKTVERELRRANELKTNYPSTHQWYVAYLTSRQLYHESSGQESKVEIDSASESRLALQIPSVRLTPAEEVQILCSVARDQMAIGNYEAAKLMLRNWATAGKWPKLDHLNVYAAGDLLFTAGTLFGVLAGSKQVLHGHRHAEALLNGSLALFEQLGIRSRSAEARVELTRCYYRQGLLSLARETISVALSEVPCDELEIKIFALIIYGVIEKDFGRITDAVAILREAANIEVTGHLVTGRCNIDLATTLKDFALSEHDESYLVEAKFHFFQALYEAEALGHHLNVACVENNIGFLLLNVGSYAESEPHLLRARKIFQAFGDSVRGAQVNDTLARLYVEMKEYKRAQGIIDNAVEALELTDSEGILAEALTTKGVVACGLGNYGDAKLCFDAAYKVAERCGDYQGAGRALLALFEQMGEHLNTDEVLRMVEKLKRLVLAIHQPYLAARIEQSIARTLSAAEGRDTAPR